MHTLDTIAAITTGMTHSAIGLIRISGSASTEVLNKIFSKPNLNNKTSHTLHFGHITDPETGEIVDEVVVSWFKGPHSFTGEDVIEISCHGSPYILNRVLFLCLAHGARLAEPGEFTKRAFLNRKMDLTQAEAVADVIASENKAQHDIAIQQMRGGFSSELKDLRQRLVRFASLIELELDFSEEDVEFADRSAFIELVHEIRTIVQKLVDSFAYGNVIKEGVPVAIIGKPNAGKSSLLNSILNEERAIVSDIPGTTRDTLEDVVNIEGIQFRFIDTAGIRETADKIEAIGVQKAKEKAAKAKIILYLFTYSDNTTDEVIHSAQELYREDAILILIENKIDLYDGSSPKEFIEEIQHQLKNLSGINYLPISTHNPKDIESVKKLLLSEVNSLHSGTQTIVTNIRHRDALTHCQQSLERVLAGIDEELSNELLAQDIREALRHLGTITGEIEIDKDILGTIFSEFCIGK